MIYQLMCLDMRLVKPYMKSILILTLIVGPVFAVVLKNNSMMVMYIVLSVIMSIAYPFTIVEKKNGNLLYNVLPVSKKQTVAGRYLYIVALTLASAVIMTVLNLIVNPISGGTIAMGDMLSGVLWLIASVFAIAAYQLPLFFKLGYEKARIWSYVPIFLIGGGAMLAGEYLKNIDLTWLIGLSPVYFALGACVLMFISYGVSVKCYK